MAEGINNNQKVFKVDVLSDKVIKLEKRCKDLEDDLIEANLIIARLSERMTLYQMTQGGFTVVASAVATAIAVMLGG